jgi:Mitochondrial ribosomal protein L31
MVRICALFCFIIEIPTYRKVPWRLSATRKANVRDRLKKVDAVIEAVRASGVQCASLVCSHTRVIP